MSFSLRQFLMKATRIVKVGLVASLLVGWCGTAGGAIAFSFGRPAPEQSAPVEMTPEIQAASQRVDQTKTKLDQARRQLDAAKASLKAADAEYRAAKADMEALTLRRQADNLADATRTGQDAAPATAGNGPPGGRLVPTDRIDPNGLAKTSAPVPAAPDQQGDYAVTDGQTSPPIQ
jgi:hypothetical protein